MRDPLRDPGPLIRRVYAYVAYRVDNPYEAEDITSETFERALRYRTSFDSRRGEPISWLIGIAKRCLADRQHRADVPSDDVPDAVEEGHEFAAVRRASLARAMAGLSERDRDMLALRYGADMTAREIAGALELRQNTVEVALHRALQRLRSELREDDSDGPFGYAASADAP